MTTYSNKINVIASSRSIPSLRLMITNTQNVSTPAGLQVLATVPLTFEKYSVDFDKIAFYYNGNPVYSWVESVSNGSMNVWLKMPVSIPANTSITINAIPYNKTVFDNNYWGCAPTLTNQYGQYDNGTNVFNFYDNFAGTTLKSSWSLFGPKGTTIVNNSLILTDNVGWWGYKNTYQVSPPSIMDFYGKQAQIGAGPAIGTYTGAFFELRPTDPTPEWGIEQTNNGSISGTNRYGGSSAVNTWYLVSGIYNSGSQSLITNYTTTQVKNTLTLGTSNLVVAAFYPSSVFQWVRVRAYPPNNVMPSITVSY